MFKVDLELPTQIKKGGQRTPKSQRPPEISSDEIQGLMKELKGAPSAGNVSSGKKHPRETQPSSQPPEIPSKDKKKRKKNVPVENPKPKTTHNQQAGSPGETSVKQTAVAQQPAKKLTPLQQKMQQKLHGARFRWINEQLYTTQSPQALELFKKQPEVFAEYHQGFRHQVEIWPENPIDTMVTEFKQRLLKPLNVPGGLPAEKSGEIVVADMGCGEAELALQLSRVKGSSKSKKAKFTTHSFDLAKGNDRITVADIANVPLPPMSCHLVVYCLALMGTNTIDFLKEGLRILKPRGEMWIAEIKSRFDDEDYSNFIAVLQSLGLKHKSTDDSNKMFVRFEFTNMGKPKTQSELPEKPLLKPCLYKRR